MEPDPAPVPSSATPPSSTVSVAPTNDVPRTKGHRPWKTPKSRPARQQRRTASLKLTLDAKNRRREKRAALVQVLKAAKDADAAAKEAERKRREARKKQKAENEARSTQKIVITDPKKIARMSKKQYLKYVHQKPK